MPDVAKLTKKRLGELLREQGLVNEEHIQKALDRQKKTGELMGRALIEMGPVTERDIARVLCTQFGVPYVDVQNCMPNEELVNEIPDSFIQKYSFLPLDKIGDVVVIAVSGVFDKEFFEELRRITGCEIQIVISTRSKIEQSLIEKLNIDPDEFDIHDTEDYIERDPEEKEVDDVESELIEEIDEEVDQSGQKPETEPLGTSPAEEEVEKTKTFTLDENEEGEPVIDLESEAERVLNETEEELNKEEEQDKKEEVSSSEQQASTGSS